MSNKINLNLGSNVLSFNFGAFDLDYIMDDAKDAVLQSKARELDAKGKELQGKEDDLNDEESRKEVKPLIDEFFTTMFDDAAPKKIYEAAGNNTWNYLNVFMQISVNINKEWNKKLNDETFKKYLAE